MADSCTALNTRVALGFQSSRFHVLLQSTKAIPASVYKGIKALTLRRFLTLALRLRGLVQRERKTRTGLSLPRRLSAWRHGFVSESLLNYDLDTDNFEHYLSDYARHVKTPDINGNFKAALDNKLFFSRIFPSEVLPTPTIRFWVDRDSFTLLGDHSTPVDHSEILDFCRSARRTIIKSVDGGGGANVFAIEFKDGRFLVNGQEIAMEDFLKRRSRSILTDYVVQHSYAMEIFPKASNTVRMLTMWDYESGEPFIADAVHRFGTNATIPADNWSRGGLSVSIDLESGRLGTAKMHPSTGARGTFEKHPDSGTQITGATIPDWKSVCAGVLRAARTAPFIPYIGWDVVVTESGFVALEGNNFPDVNLLQTHRPLLNDARVRKFFEHHGVIRPLVAT